MQAVQWRLGSPQEFFKHCSELEQIKHFPIESDSVEELNDPDLVECWLMNLTHQFFTQAIFFLSTLKKVT